MVCVFVELQRQVSLRTLRCGDAVLGCKETCLLHRAAGSGSGTGQDGGLRSVCVKGQGGRWAGREGDWSQLASRLRNVVAI